MANISRLKTYSILVLSSIVVLLLFFGVPFREDPSGPPGPAGHEGPQGSIGPKGDQGLVGQTGPEGTRGLVGPEGPQGPRGNSGEPGPAGPQGQPGVAGPQGVQGIQGAKGDKGDKGDRGPTGLQGPEGPVGPSASQLLMPFASIRTDFPSYSRGGTVIIFGTGFTSSAVSFYLVGKPGSEILLASNPTLLNAYGIFTVTVTIPESTELIGPASILVRKGTTLVTSVPIAIF